LPSPGPPDTMVVMGPPDGQTESSATVARPPEGATSVKGASTASRATKAKATKAKATKATKSTKAAKATKATKATKAAKKAPTARKRAVPLAGHPGEEAGGGRTGFSTSGGLEPVSDWGPAGRRFRGQARNRALYSRPLQRNFEHWSLGARCLAAVLRHPELVLASLGKREPLERDGRVLNRNTQAIIELIARFDPAGRGSQAGARLLDTQTMRKQMRASARVTMPVRTDVHVWGRTIPGDRGNPGIPIRVYRRFGEGVGIGPDEQGRPPAIVYFHGGGWVLGDLDTHDAICRLLAAASRCVVVAVDYRLAPEHPFPAAVDDSLTAYAWVHHNSEELGIAAGRVGVMGDSAGGNLAAVVAQQSLGVSAFLPDDVPPPVAQGLIYPAVDARLDTDSSRSLQDGFLLTGEVMEFFREQYVPNRSDWEDPRASPLMADDFTGGPPALVVTAGFDPLREDGVNYAEALRKGGVEVEYRCYQDQIHGFLGAGILPDSLALATEVCDAMGQMMRRPVGAVGSRS